MSRLRGEGSVYRKGAGWEASAYIRGRRRSVRAATARPAADELQAMQTSVASSSTST